MKTKYNMNCYVGDHVTVVLWRNGVALSEWIVPGTLWERRIVCIGDDVRLEKVYY